MTARPVRDCLLLIVLAAAAHSVEPYRIRAIRIEGNARTCDDVIRREVLLRPGDLFRASLAHRTRERLLGLGIFRAVRVEPRRSAAPGGPAADLWIRVEELPAGALRGGGGYSAGEGLFGTLDLRGLNLRGRARRLETAVDLGTRRRRIALTFAGPWLLGRPVGFSARVAALRHEPAGLYTRRAYGFELRAEPRGRLPRGIGICSGLIVERERYGDDPIRDRPGTAPNVVLTRIDVGLRRPRGEVRVDYTLGLGLGGPLGDAVFRRHDLSVGWRRPLRRTAFRIGARLGTIEVASAGDDRRLGPWNRYTPGGVDRWDGQVRGYPDQGLGPRVAGLPVGGRALFVVNAEWEIPLWRRRLRGLVFADAGEAWRAPGDVEPGDLKRSAGVGLRLPMPGPDQALGLDAAYGFDRRRVDGRPPGWRLHLQLGPRRL